MKQVMDHPSKFIRVDLNITPTYIYVVFQVDMDGIHLVSMLRGEIGDWTLQLLNGNNRHKSQECLVGVQLTNFLWKSHVFFSCLILCLKCNFEGWQVLQ
jgi:hypothetical protein